MAVPQLGNFAQSTDASTMTNVATSATLASTAGFVVPTNGRVGVVRVDDVNAGGYNDVTGPFEIIYYTTNAANVLGGFLRGQEGTSGHAFAAGSRWSQSWTGGSILAGVPFKLEEQVIGGAVGSVTIPATGTIPATYLGVSFRDLEIRYVLHDNAAAVFVELFIRANADSGTHYGQQVIRGNGTTAQATDYAGTAQGAWVQQYISAAQAFGAANVVGWGKIHVPWFAQAAFHKVMTNSWGMWGINVGLTTSGGLFSGQNTGIWVPVSDAAITSMSLTPASGSIDSGIVETFLIP